MKAIFTPSQQRAHDLCIQQAEGISALSLMERAAFRLYKTMLPEIQCIQPKHIAVLVGPGNNGGDGLALARYLSAHSMVQVLRLNSAQYSPENMEQAQALIPLSHRIHLTDFQLDRPDEFQSFLTTDLWIDALFGNGLSRPLHVDFSPFFAWILSMGKPVWAIDSPSGLPSRPEEFGLENPVLPAQNTYCIDRPAFSMLFPESAPFLGQWQVVPLSHFESKDPDAKLGCWVESADVQRRLPKRGFVSLTHKLCAGVRLSDLEKIKGDSIDLAALKLAGIVAAGALRAKVFLSGSLTRKLSLTGIAATKGAQAAIEAAGGSIVLPEVKVVEGKKLARQKAKAEKRIADAAKPVVAAVKPAAKPKAEKKPKKGE